LREKTFIEYAKTNYGVTVTFDQAVMLRELWLKSFPEMELHLQPEKDPSHPDMFIAKNIQGWVKPNTMYCAACNAAFQSLAASSTKLALWELYRNNIRTNLAVHDEAICELEIGPNLQKEVALVQECMIKGMGRVVKHVPIRVESALMIQWNKKAKPIYGPDGETLLIWTPDVLPLTKKDPKVVVKVEALLKRPVEDMLKMDPKEVADLTPEGWRPLFNHKNEGLYGWQPLASAYN